ncbi:LPXTG cell wall anchor domain-containing protein, partial [Christensenellaceae bacterium OttesenSCG-928-L17]|nr:LPXTG cell wall anchor domain-containing protein [Christensenellaceae bacterium OttesenSCG-928-L17]
AGLPATVTSGQEIADWIFIINEGEESEPNDKGIYELYVVNSAGTELPETGGIGRTIFYVIGSALLLGAVILFVTKKRMSGDKEA